MNYSEEYDKAKSKVLKYILYKKRSKQEVKNKFSSVISNEMLEEIMDELEEMPLAISLYFTSFKDKLFNAINSATALSI